jgi:4'-phosphopantetheinyl transferase
MKWYKFNINDFTDELYSEYYSLLSNERREYVDSLKIETDRKRTVAGEMLVKIALGLRNETILRTDEGQPYIAGMDNHFSISHSGNFAVCAIDKCKIGIDIEEIRNIDIKAAKRFCNEKELEYVGNDINRFFEIWTAKEATYKMMGGKIKNFKDIDTFNVNKQYCSFLDHIVCIVRE